MGKAVVLFFACFLVLFLLQSPTSDKTPETVATPDSSLPPPPATDFADYIWPTDAGRLVTSVFAEFRTTHFHGGIDISTGDDTGFRVFAARDGYVARIVVSPTGYGNMLWVRHADGFFTTYAHLRNFHDAIDRRVAGEQRRLERFPVDIECGPEEFPVKRGDVIAFTGETGTGSPHLHFEIRDPNKDFVNPLLCNEFSFPDNIPPSIYRVGLTPLDEHSRVNNSPNSRVIEFTTPVQGTFTFPETLHATGSIGFVVDARDRIDGSRFRNGVYRHELFLDDSLIYAVQLDSAPSSDDFQAGLYYDFGLMEDEGGRLARLYANSPNRLPFYQPRRQNAGVIPTDKFAEGIHSFRIVTRDFARNKVELEGKIAFSVPPEITVTSSDGLVHLEVAQNLPMPEILGFTTMIPGNGRISPRWKEERISLNHATFSLSELRGRYDVLKLQATDPFGARSLPRFVVAPGKILPAAAMEIEHEVLADFVQVALRTSGVFTSTPSIALLEGTTSRLLKATPVEFDSYTATFRPMGSIGGKRTVVVEAEVSGSLQSRTHEIDLFPVLPGHKASMHFDSGNLVVTASAHAVYKPLYLEVEKAGDGPAYALKPRHTVLNEGVMVRVRGDGENFNQGLFFRRRGSWVLLSRSREGDFVVGTLRRTLGEIALLTDTTPPVIHRLHLPSSFSRQPHVLSFSVRDNLSGVEYKELKLYIDGTFAIPEIDGEHRRVKHRFAEPLQRGPHSLVIRVTDRMGNTNEVRRTFRIR